MSGEQLMDGVMNRWGKRDAWVGRGNDEGMGDGCLDACIDGWKSRLRDEKMSIGLMGEWINEQSTIRWITHFGKLFLSSQIVSIRHLLTTFPRVIFVVGT